MDSHHQPSDHSFLLRFWYEPSELLAAHWRGSVWHQQAPHVGHQPVTGPEEAFELVRNALAAAEAPAGAQPRSAAPAGGPGAAAPPPPPRRRFSWPVLLERLCDRMGGGRR